MNSFLTFVKCEDAFLEGEQNMDPETRRKQYIWGFLPPSCPQAHAADMLGQIRQAVQLMKRVIIF